MKKLIGSRKDIYLLLLYTAMEYIYISCEDVRMQHATYCSLESSYKLSTLISEQIIPIFTLHNTTMKETCILSINSLRESNLFKQLYERKSKRDRNTNTCNLCGKQFKHVDFLELHHRLKHNLELINHENVPCVHDHCNSLPCYLYAHYARDIFQYNKGYLKQREIICDPMLKSRYSHTCTKLLYSCLNIHQFKNNTSKLNEFLTLLFQKLCSHPFCAEEEEVAYLQSPTDTTFNANLKKIGFIVLVFIFVVYALCVFVSYFEARDVHNTRMKMRMGKDN